MKEFSCPRSAATESRKIRWKRHGLGLVGLGALMALSAGPAHATVKDFVVYVERANSEYVDIGTTGPSVGDIRVNTQHVRRSLHGEVIGTSIARLITVQLEIPGGDEIREAMIQYTLPGGTITLSSIHNFPSGALYPERVVRTIIGGTGKFAGVRGTSVFNPIDKDKAVVTFRFTK